VTKASLAGYSAEEKIFTCFFQTCPDLSGTGPHGMGLNSITIPEYPVSEVSVRWKQILKDDPEIRQAGQFLKNILMGKSGDRVLNFSTIQDRQEGLM
jgi:hypothetical protein